MIEDGSLKGPSAQGLTACTALTQLILGENCLASDDESSSADDNSSSADDDDEWNGWDDDGHESYYNSVVTTGGGMIPTGMGLLTQLHTLHLKIGNHCGVANLSWISQMTPLAELNMAFGKCDEEIMQYVPLLTNLARLAVEGLCGYEEVEVNFDIAWHKLQALQELSVCWCNIQLGPGIGGLLKLDKLQQISFEDSCLGSDCANIACFGALTYHLARHRPEVKLLLAPGSHHVLEFVS